MMMYNQLNDTDVSMSFFTMSYCTAIKIRKAPLVKGDEERGSDVTHEDCIEGKGGGAGCCFSLCHVM